MVAVTYGVAPTTDSKRVDKEKGVFTLMFEAMAASQMLRAEREMARYRELMARADEPFGDR